ncbi:MAG: hypothetical protein LDL39_13810 [Magnetospirillum sp.]|nr:hypothetical protein [Magnetospirillum sp.]
MGHHPESLVKRVGHRIGVAIADHPLLAPRLHGILKGLPRDEQERIVLDLGRELGSAALDATFNGGP